VGLGIGLAIGYRSPMLLIITPRLVDSMQGTHIKLIRAQGAGDTTYLSTTLARRAVH